MKKAFLLLIITLFFIKAPYLNAECKEIKDFVNKDDFVFVTEMDEQEPYIIIEVYNIFYPFVYVVIEEDYTNTKNKYYFEDVEDNYLSIKYTNISRSTKYKIQVYGNIESCQDELLRNVEFSTTPKNQYYDTSICSENRDYEGCKIFANNKNITLEDLEKKVNEFVENSKKDNNEKNSENNKIINFFKNINWKIFIYIFIPVFLIGVFFIIRILILKRRNRK